MHCILYKDPLKRFYYICIIIYTNRITQDGEMILPLHLFFQPNGPWHCGARERFSTSNISVLQNRCLEHLYAGRSWSLFLTQMWKWMSPVPQFKSTGTHTPALLYLPTNRLTWYRGPFVHGSFTKEALIQPCLACCFFLGCLSKKKKKPLQKKLNDTYLGCTAVQGEQAAKV